MKCIAVKSLLLAAALGLGACATRPLIDSQTRAGTNFAAYRSYAYVEQLGTDKAGYLDYSFGEYPGRGYVNIFRAVDGSKYVCTTHYEVFCPESMEDVKRLCAL